MNIMKNRKFRLGLYVLALLAAILSVTHVMAEPSIAVCLDPKEPLKIFAEQFIANYTAKTRETFCPQGKESKCYNFSYHPKFKVMQKTDSSGDLVLVLKGREFEVTVTDTKLIATRSQGSLKYELVLVPRVSEFCANFTGEHKMTFTRVRELSDGRRIVRVQEGIAQDDLIRIMKE